MRSVEANELEKKLTEYAKIGLPAATAIAAVAVGVVQGPAMAILVLAGGALVAVIAIFWASVRTLVGETPLSGADAYAIGALRAEEEQKRSVLRALKDLEFERSVGKISEEDYRLLVAKYRMEAKRLLRLLDAEAQPRIEHVEMLVAKRLRREGLADNGYRDAVQAESTNTEPLRAVEPIDGSTPVKATSAKSGKRRKRAQGAERPLLKPVAQDTAAAITCGACGTENDADAVFCKKCGARQEPVAAEQIDGEDAGTASHDGEQAS